MKWKSHLNIKKFCHSSDCKVVTIGFRWNDNFACKTCGQEITEDLYKKLKDRERLWNEQNY